MAVEIREIRTRKELKRFIEFANDLYKDCPYYCPPLFFDEMNCFTPEKNPALEVSEFRLWMAYRDNKPVGRIAGIINHRANEKWGFKHVRFGWFDFIDDFEVSKALLDTVAAWGKEHGMDALNGPVGFTDFDHEGLLLEGYEYLAPMASLYNYPYYVKHVDAYGLKKEVDWIEMQILPPLDWTERQERLCQVIMQRAKVHPVKVKNARELVRRFGTSYMDIIDQAYQRLYNFQPMTERQKNYYKDMYFPILNFDFVSLIVNEKDELVCVGLGMPDISKALRKCGGRLFPFGWYHILKAFRHFDTIDLLLNGVLPEWQKRGVHSIYYCDMNEAAIRYDVHTAYTNPQIIGNEAVKIWETQYNTTPLMQRAVFGKSL